MKAHYKVAGLTSMLLLLAFSLLWSTRSVSAAAEGKITGTVKLDGAAPHMKGIDMSKDPFCVKQHENNPAHLENVVVGAGGGLENVVLYISEGLSATEASQTPTQEPVFDQKNCMYTPHVLAMDVNQKFKVMTSDQTTHNIHPLPNPLAGNIPWNKSQPPGAPPIEDKYGRPEFIPVKCNIHPWMKGTLAVMKNAHYSITAEDGEFKLPNLAPGTYTITAWHESYGEQSQEVTISGSESKTISFVFKAKPY